MAEMGQAVNSGTAFLADMEQAEEVAVGGRLGASKTAVTCCWDLANNHK